MISGVISSLLTDALLHNTQKNDDVKPSPLICLLELAPWIIIHLLHYISPLNYTCYKGKLPRKCVP